MGLRIPKRKEKLDSSSGWLCGGEHSNSFVLYFRGRGCFTPFARKDSIPQVKYKLTRWSGIALGGYVLITANDSIVKDWSKRGKAQFPYAVPSVMFMSGLASVVIGILTTCQREGRPGLNKCFDWQCIQHAAKLNICFQIAGFLKFAALIKIPPDAVSILSQVNLFLLAVAIRIFARKKFSTDQWLCLVMISCGVVLYISSREGQTLWIAWLLYFLVASFHLWYQWQQKFFKRRVLAVIQVFTVVLTVVYKWMKGQHWFFSGSDHSAGWNSDVLQGCLFILLMCLCETVASVLLELYFKGGSSEPVEGGLSTPVNFYIQKVHVDCSTVVFSGIAFMFFCLWHPSDAGLMDHSSPGFSFLPKIASIFTGWDHSTVVVLLLMVCKAWLAGLVAKLLDSVMKQIGSSMAICLMFFEMNFFHPFATPATFVSIAVVLLGILSFTACSIRDEDASWPSEYPKHLAGKSSTSQHCL